jgi:hypothetical protein
MPFNNEIHCGTSTPTTILPPQAPPRRPLINSRLAVSQSFQPIRPPTTGAFAAWMRSLRASGHALYAITVTYCDNASTPFTVGSANRRGHRFYNYLLTRLFDRRHYNAPEYRPLQPLMVLFLDVPGSKRKNPKPQSSKSNTAPFHHHGFVAARPSLTASIDALADHLQIATRDSSLLDGIQSVLIKPLDFNIGKWTRYATAFDRGEYLLLPKSNAEFYVPRTGTRQTGGKTTSNAQPTN